MPVKNELQLFKERRFAPLFVTQFFGAFNDNLFKNALIILLAFGKPNEYVNPNTLINLCAALFIVPYFLFSSFAGQLADKFEKSFLISVIKFAEIVLACLAVIGFYLDDLSLLLSALFLLGTQATFFGPVKYSILPQLLTKTELMGGNGLIEMGTFFAILLGTIFGTVLIAIPHTGIVWVSVFMGLIALFGFFASLFIPRSPSLTPELPIQWNIFRHTFQLVSEACKQKSILYIIIGISWFWFYGSIFLSQTPNYTKINLKGDEHVATLLLVAFSVGIGLGSSLCEWLSSKKIDIGFVFVGLIGLTLFSLDLAFSTPRPPPEESLSAWTFLVYQQNIRILIDSFLMGAFGGLYLVPLYTLIQLQSDPAYRSRVIAANNIINALFMVAASVLAIVILNLNFSIPDLFILTALLNISIGLYLIKLYKLIHLNKDQKFSYNNE